jgi:hypothetical protein
LAWNHLVTSYLYGIATIPLSLLPFFLGILCLINDYISDGQDKEPQQQQRGEQQWGEQPGCQLTATPAAYSWASAGYARTNTSDHAADHDQHVTCSTPSATTAAEE